MALQKNITASNGSTVSYWKIHSIRLNADKSFAEIRLDGYLNQANRQAYQSTMVKEMRLDDAEVYAATFAPDVLDAAGNNPFKAAYEWLKTTTDFNNATDVLETNEFA
jgi:hypothetical protein